MTWAKISGTAEDMGNFQQTLVLMSIGGTIVLIAMLVIWNVVTNRAGATGDGRVDASAHLPAEDNLSETPTAESGEGSSADSGSHP
jgi:hypothetical protein